MKKLFVFAAAAVAVLAACTKNEVNQTPDQAITFQIANYSAQTKAPTSLITEGFNSFKSYAWYTPATGTANQAFMTPATIEYDNTNTPAIWHATDRTYFWPKTGYVNFFSFAGNHYPTTVSLNASNCVEVAYTDVEIATSDNILAANGAYGFFSNPNATYGHNGVEKGVPTLFRHMLSKVKFDVKVDATEVSDNKNKWEVVIDSAIVSYRDQGTLTFSYPATPAITFDANGKPTTAGVTQSFNTPVWTPKNVKNDTLSKKSSVVTTFALGGAVSTIVPLINESVVMPQNLDPTTGTNVTIRLRYTITHTYNDANPIVETVPVAEKTLISFDNHIDAWVPNTIYTYHIIIKPNGEILFDPAVEEWVAESTEPSYTIL